METRVAHWSFIKRQEVLKGMKNITKPQAEAHADTGVVDGEQILEQHFGGEQLRRKQLGSGQSRKGESTEPN